MGKMKREKEKRKGAELRADRSRSIPWEQDPERRRATGKKDRESGLKPGVLTEKRKGGQHKNENADRLLRGCVLRGRGRTRIGNLSIGTV